MYAPMANPEVAKAVQEGNECLGRAFSAAVHGHFIQAAKHLGELFSFEKTADPSP